MNKPSLKRNNNNTHKKRYQNTLLREPDQSVACIRAQQAFLLIGAPARRLSLHRPRSSSAACNNLFDSVDNNGLFLGRQRIDLAHIKCGEAIVKSSVIRLSSGFPLACPVLPPVQI